MNIEETLTMLTVRTLATTNASTIILNRTVIPKNWNCWLSFWFNFQKW